MRSLSDRFWSKVPVRPFDGCWEWKGSTKGNGYGQINVRGKPCFAHRVSFEIENGAIEDGLIVRHKCDNPICVRPDHLETGSQKQNMIDMKTRGRERHFTHSGERNPAAKISDSDVSKIKADRSNSQSCLAKKYGVSVQRISQIQDRKNRNSLNKSGEFVETTKE